ncbi:dienelactone hydrolase family protein [Lichenihabitans sp. PAMC28606]|uniref:alpha/beta hydrolase n=1 Tax=Lichenihabitans sp. PAMC28606 TaxID=2880932 RepID=UPI001D0B079D|nr:dienelactone hydrolase family protein [Lichenihabitans sp. PAMC28606]UDL93314.1 dienelactone hydrolase family protein [Lichenihabitans sp. PAMC28606]
MTLPIDGPRLNPKSGLARQLVVFLHGYGADGRDLIEIGRQWQHWLPDAAFVAPNAPERCVQSPTGRQWFDLTSRDPGERWRGVVKARPGLDAFLDAELATHKLDDSKLALVGFSQGTMMALHTGLRRRRAPASIIGYSGLLVGPEHLDEATARTTKGATPPILLVHGDADQVIPLEALFDSADHLGKANIPAEWHLSLGVGHGIDGAGLEHGGLFLARNFGLPTPKRP